MHVTARARLQWGVRAASVSKAESRQQANREMVCFSSREILTRIDAFPRAKPA